MAIALTGDWTRPTADQGDGRNAVLTNRGEAALLLICLERIPPRSVEIRTAFPYFHGCRPIARLVRW